MHLIYLPCNKCHATQTPMHPVSFRTRTHAIFWWCSVDHSNRMNWAWCLDATANMTGYKPVLVRSSACRMSRDCFWYFTFCYYIKRSIFRTPDESYLSIATWSSNVYSKTIFSPRPWTNRYNPLWLYEQCSWRRNVPIYTACTLSLVVYKGLTCVIMK